MQNTYTYTTYSSSYVWSCRSMSISVVFIVIPEVLRMM